MKLAIFDMDGTLYNTNNVNYYAYKEALDQFDVKLDYDYYCKFCNGRHYKVFIPPLVDFDEEKVEKIHELKKEFYSKHLDKIIINEHLFKIISLIKSEYNIALVTTASKKNTLELLKATNKEKYFNFIITQEDIKNPKPDPEGFISAMKKFNAKSEDTIIFEDSKVGIEAAQKTGANIMVINKF